MSLRTVVLIAASVVIGIAYIGTFSAETFAATAPAGTKRINPHHVHHGNKVHHSGQAHRNVPATSPAGTTTGIGTGKP
jgi:hypothetical protein